MKPLTMLLSLCCTMTLSSQDWPHPESQWFYYASGLQGGPDLVYVIGDTTIAGETFRVLKAEFTISWPQPYGPPIETTYEFFPGFVRQSGDSVFYRKGGDIQEFLLFDFGAQIGDSWICRIGGVGDPVCSDTSRLEVIDVGTISVNGLSRRFIEVEPTEDSYWALEGVVVEGVGLISPHGGYELFPRQHCCDTTVVCDGGSTALICYTDATIGNYEVGGILDCPEALGTQESIISQLDIHPNPTRGSIHLRLPENLGISRNQIHSISIVQLNGQVVKKISAVQIQSAEHLLNLNLSDLPSGIYVLRLVAEDAVYQTQVVKE